MHRQSHQNMTGLGKNYVLSPVSVETHLSVSSAQPRVINQQNGKLKCHQVIPVMRQRAFTNGHVHSLEENVDKCSYMGKDYQLRLYDDEDFAQPALLDQDFYSFHRNVPGLRRTGVDANTIRQHFYPDGGWGWIICGIAFLAHILTTGFQLSYGLMSFYALQHLANGYAVQTVLLGAISWAISMFVSPIILAICRRKSTRLTAVLGGLVYALGILFTSFATLFLQVAFSYGIVVGIGAAMVRESSAVMLGLYFKKRRQFVEMITMSGEGIGIALFSVILKEGVGKMGWRFGLQIIAVIVSSCFFMGLLYRSASLYHPQRHAILHLKNQRKKVKEKKTHIRTPKQPFIDFSPFKSSTVRMFIICSTIASLGAYTPIFFISLQGSREGFDVQDLVLLQAFLGLAIALGVVISGLIINRHFSIARRKLNISRQIICQVNIILVAVSTLIISVVANYRALCLLGWSYGLGLGGYRYTLKMLALERIRPKYFTKAWGFIRSAESIAILFGVPVTVILNDSSHQHGQAGYYICAAGMAISAILMCFIECPSDILQHSFHHSTQGSIMSHCTIPTSDCSDMLNRSFLTSHCPNWNNNSHSQCTTIMNACSSKQHSYCIPSHHCQTAHNTSCLNRFLPKTPHNNLYKSLSFAFQYPMWYSLAQTNEVLPNPHHVQNEMKCDTPNLPVYPLRSRSVPEGLEQVLSKYRGCYLSSNFHHQHVNNRPIHIVEQMTTSV